MSTQYKWLRKESGISDKQIRMILGPHIMDKGRIKRKEIHLEYKITQLRLHRSAGVSRSGKPKVSISGSC